MPVHEFARIWNCSNEKHKPQEDVMKIEKKRITQRDINRFKTSVIQSMSDE